MNNIGSGLATLFNRENISCIQCRSRQRLDTYNEHLFHCSGKTKAHHAAVGEILKMCTQAGIVTIKEPVGYMINPNRRPDLVLCNFMGKNKPTLVDFTSISALSGKVIHRSWKSQGFAAEKAIEDKYARYADAYDPSTYEFHPIAMEVGGRPSPEMVKFMKWVASQAGVNLNWDDDDEPRMYRAQFAFKWRCRIVLAFKKTLVEEMLHVQQKLIRCSVPRNNFRRGLADLYRNY